MSKIISLTIEHNGELITLTPEGALAPVINDIEYAKDGFSVETNLGCVRNKEVDDFLLAMSQGNKFEKQVAAESPVWFANFVDGREYDDATRKLLIRNYQQHNNTFTFISGGGMSMFENFYPSITRDPADTRAPFTYIYGVPLEGCTTAIRGFNPFAAHKEIAADYISLLTRKAAELKFYSENPNAPVAEVGKT